MNMKAHLDSLKGKHADLEIKISREKLRPMPNQAELADLKKQKLKIKEELTHYNGAV